VRITLTRHERELILKYGYPEPDLEKRLEKKRDDPNEASFVIDDCEAGMLVGDLSISMNEGQVPDALLEEVDALASYFESLM
jgi:hypothetical protein